MPITTSNPHSQFKELINVTNCTYQIILASWSYINLCTRAKLSQRLYVTDTCLLNLVGPRGQILTRPGELKKFKVKYAYMCNLTSQAQHASPI